MIRYLNHNQIDTQRWNNCIEQSSNGNIYVWSWYLDIAHPSWEALVDDDYQYVMPLTGNKKFGINYLFQPFFTQKFGIFSKNEVKKEKIEEFLNAIPSKFRFADFRFGRIDSIDGNKSSYIIDNHINIELSLNPNYTTLFENYNSNTKRNLAKAKKEDLKIEENAEPSLIIDLFRNNRGREIKHWDDREYERLLKLVETAKEHGKCFVLGVKNTDNQVVTGAFFMTSHNKIVFLFSGADESNKESHALTFLIDYVIEKYSGDDKILDFEGSDNDGLARFYKGFGGKETVYQGIRFNRTKGITKLALKVIKRL